MDTHMTHMELEPSVRQTARLPGEPPPDAPLGPDQATAPALDETDARAPELAAKPQRKRRGRLLAGVALGSLTLATGAVFLFSPLNTAIPLPPSVLVLADQAKLAFAQGAQQVQGYVTGFLGSDENVTPAPRSSASAAATPAVPIVAPAASLAGTRLPPRPDTVTASRYSAQPRDQSLEEIRSFGAAKPAEPAQVQAKPPAAPALAPTPTKPGKTPLPDPAPDVAEPGSTANTAAPVSSKPAPPDITASVTQAALIQPTMPATGSAEPTAAPVPQPEMVVVPRVVQPAVAAPQSAPDAATMKPLPQANRPAVLVLSVPEGHQEQAEVLQFVTGLTSEIARLRTENELLRKDLGRRMAEQDGRLADFNRRVSVAEARAAMRSAADVGKSDETPSSMPLRPMQLASASPAIPPMPTDSRPAVTPANRLRYRVQAASPGLALLAEVGRGGGDGAQLQVAVGDQIPGYGVVKSVSQKGPNWVVQTERGSID